MVRRPVADRLSGSQAALPVLRAALKPIAATESVNEVVKQVQDAAIQTVSAASRVGPVRDLDFDAFMHLGVTAWERADAAWTARLEAAFYAHASVVRVDEHGVTMQSVEGVEATPDAGDRKEGYRCVLQQPSTCEAALRDVDATLSAEEVCACPLGQIARPPREEQRLTFTAAHSCTRLPRPLLPCFLDSGGRSSWLCGLRTGGAGIRGRSTTTRRLASGAGLDPPLIRQPVRGKPDQARNRMCTLPAEAKGDSLMAPTLRSGSERGSICQCVQVKQCWLRWHGGAANPSGPGFVACRRR